MGADIVARDILGMTPLHIAAKANQVKVLEMMLDKNNNMDVKVEFPERREPQIKRVTTLVSFLRG
eukprot:119332-Amorphochlora_amoeboformis.AAC.1